MTLWKITGIIINHRAETDPAVVFAWAEVDELPASPGGAALAGRHWYRIDSIERIGSVPRAWADGTTPVAAEDRPGLSALIREVGRLDPGPPQA